MEKDIKKRNDAQSAESRNQIYDNTKYHLLSMLTNKPQSRFDLADKLGVNEREVRRCIHDLRNEGHLIVSDSRGAGYKFGSRKEAMTMADELRKRAYDLLRTARKIEGTDPNQISMEEISNVLL